VKIAEIHDKLNKLNIVKRISKTSKYPGFVHLTKRHSLVSNQVEIICIFRMANFSSRAILMMKCSRLPRKHQIPPQDF
jgi:hypothetical protein